MPSGDEIYKTGRVYENVDFSDRENVRAILQSTIDFFVEFHVKNSKAKTANLRYTIDISEKPFEEDVLKKGAGDAKTEDSQKEKEILG